LPLRIAQEIKSVLSDVCAPFETFISRTRLFIDDVHAVTSDAIQSGNERKIMAGQIARLNLELQQVRGSERELTELRHQMGFKAERPDLNLLPCDVISRGNTSGWWETITLNRGSDDGVCVNLAVVTRDGVVGKTVAVSRKTCEVLLITDPNCKVVCEFSGPTRGFGIVQGRGVSSEQQVLQMLYGQPQGNMTFIDRDFAVGEGVEIVTSEISGIFPQGLKVGRVVQSSLDASKLYRRAVIVPAADLQNLRYVFVVVLAARSPGLPGADGVFLMDRQAPGAEEAEGDEP
jgi:rod shape-determining protein MreC